MMPQMKLITIVDKITKSLDDEKYDLSPDIKAFRDFIATMKPAIAQCTLPLLVSPFFALHAKQDVYKRFNEANKLRLLETLSEILTKTKLDNENAFSLLYDFLLVQIYDPKSLRAISDVSEEIKEALLDCFNILFAAMSWDLLPVIYTEKHVPKLCLLLHLCGELIRREKSRQLRLKAIECIMRAAKVDDNADFDDVVLLSQIADIFIKFLPGLASCLIYICVDDDKCGHRIVTACVKAWGRLVSILMRDYSGSDEFKPRLEDLVHGGGKINEENAVKRGHDEKLSVCADLLTRLTSHSHANVRSQLANISGLLIDTCFMTLPRTIPKIIEILMILIQDEDTDASTSAQKVLDVVNARIIEGNYKNMGLVDNLQSSFYKHLTQVPRIFNGLDDKEQITSLKLLNGYLKLFGGSCKLKTILFTQVNLTRLMGSLLHVGGLEKSGVSLLEDYALHDWETSPDTRTPWKTFKVFDKSIQKQLETACHLLVQPTVVNIVLDYLVEVFHDDKDQRAEATLLINEIVSVKSDLIDMDKRNEIIYTYLEPKYWTLQLIVGGKTVLKDVQNNIIQLCLQMEGIGKMALAVGDNFRDFMLRVLYFVLEKAGSGNQLLRAAGLSSIANISLACGYKTITSLINENAAYFSYNVINKLRRAEENESVLTVLAVVMNYSDMAVLHSISDIVEGVLMQSCDKHQERNAHSYLLVFAVFIKSMHKWLDIQITFAPMRSEQQKDEELEALRQQHIADLNKPVDCTDDIMMGKTAEQIYEEDYLLPEEYEEEENEMLEYKKPEPPRHIKLIVSILERSLNFLPAKETNRKILVLEILHLGVEILKDYDDELLPIVHKIWSPLVNRFTDEFDSPLIVNLSFSLLVTLGRLSKDFIRMRTIKEVLPSLKTVLVKQSKESYLKDRGSAYRYTQGYKMQVAILNSLGRLVYDLDVGDKVDGIATGVEVYLSCKQPMPLQEAAVNFYKTISYFDANLGSKLIQDINMKYANQSNWHKNLNILLSIT